MRNNLKADERRELTVKTVIKLCSKEDPAEITTGKIASKMKVTQGALFRHFPSKDSVWEAVANWVANKIVAQLDTSISNSQSPLSTLEDIFFKQIKFVADHPGIPRIMLGKLQSPRNTKSKKIIKTVLTKFKSRISDLLLEGQSLKEIRGDLDIEAAIIQFLGMIRGLVIDALLSENIDEIETKAPGLWDIYLAGIRHEQK